MKKLFLLFLISTNLLAFEEIYKLGDKFIPILVNDKAHTSVSKNCESKKCEALKVLKSISMKKIDSKEFQGGKNPGAVVCASLSEAKIIYLKDLSGNENTFCFLSDKSMVSSGTLEYYARKNDGVK